MNRPTNQRIITGPTIDPDGTRHHWVVRYQYESPTTYYLVAHDIITRRTTFLTKDRMPSATKVVYEEL